MKTNTKKGLYIFLDLIQVGIILILVIVAVASFGSRIPYLSKWGLNYYAVLSGSMEPTIPTGSLIHAGKYKLEDLKKGDIITFYLRKDKDPKNITIVTHRISEVIKTEKKEKVGETGKEIEKKVLKYEFVTKGDANNVIDQATVPASNIIGLYTGNVPKAGYITSFVQSPTGFALFIIIPSCVLILWEIIGVIIHFKAKYESKSKIEIEELKKQLEAKKGRKSKK